MWMWQLRSPLTLSMGHAHAQAQDASSESERLFLPVKLTGEPQKSLLYLVRAGLQFDLGDNLFLPNLLEAAGIGKLRVFGSGKSRVGLLGLYWRTWYTPTLCCINSIYSHPSFICIPCRSFLHCH